jgi:hypothetical protein
MRLTQTQADNTAATETLRSISRPRRREHPMEDMMNKLRDDLVKVFRMFGKSDKESRAAAEAITGKARESTDRGGVAADRAVDPASQGQATTNVSVVFQSISLKISSSSGKMEASIELVRMEANMTTGAALAVGLPGMAQGGQGQGSGGGGQQVDPLVFDLDGNGVDLTKAESGVLFDISADGRPDKTAWVSGGDALLALDRNGNGRIDDGRELFGDQNGASDGFAELGRFDDDGNGLINARDSVFNSLILVRANGGTSTLGDEGITEIRLDAVVPVNQRLAGGDVVAESAFSRADGSQGKLADVLLDVRI